MNLTLGTSGRQNAAWCICAYKRAYRQRRKLDRICRDVVSEMSCRIPQNPISDVHDLQKFFLENFRHHLRPSTCFHSAQHRRILDGGWGGSRFWVRTPKNAKNPKNGQKPQKTPKMAKNPKMAKSGKSGTPEVKKVARGA